MGKASYFTLASLLSLTLISGILLASFEASADESAHVSNVDIAVPASCEMSGTGTLHSANVNNGTYQEDIGKTTLAVFCNDGGGYAIYAVGYTGEEIGGTNSTKLVGVDYALTIDTGVYTQGVTTASVWSMKLNKVTDTSTSYTPANLTIENGFDSYSAVPASYTKVASFTSTTDLTLGSKLETTYAAYVSGTQRADTYNGKVKYTLVHPSSNVPNEPQACTAGKICYWPNAGNTVPDTMGDQTIDPDANEVTLWASNFKRQGYGFAGWSMFYDYSVPNGFLGPNEDIDNTVSLEKYKSEGLSLYAYWIPSAGSLQEWNGCDDMDVWDVTALTDLRDNNTYAVAKLIDEKCWMIENLRLDYDANFTESLSQGFGGVFSGLAQPETTNFTGSTTANTLYKSDGSGDIKGINGATLSDIGNTNSPNYRFPRYRNDNTNSDSTINANVTVANMTGANQNVYSYGNYYSWAAATADTDYHGTANQSVTTTSLCPTGWRLPQGGNKNRIISDDDNDFWNLVVDGMNSGTNPANYNGSTVIPNYTGLAEASPVNKMIRTYPNNFVYSGYASSSSLTNRGNGGDYWSSTASDSAFALFFSFRSTQVYPGTYNNFKPYGRAIRCVKD